MTKKGDKCHIFHIPDIQLESSTVKNMVVKSGIQILTSRRDYNLNAAPQTKCL